MKKELLELLTIQLYSKMYDVNEVYPGTIVEVLKNLLVVEVDGGGIGYIPLEHYATDSVVFMAETPVFVRIMGFCQDGHLILAFTEHYNRAYNILHKEYQGTVVTVSETAVAVYFPDFGKIGIRRPNLLRMRYKKLLKGDKVNCRVICHEDQVLIDQICGIYRNGQEIRTFDRKVYEKAISHGSIKEKNGYKVGYVYDAIVKNYGLAVLRNSDDKIILHGEIAEEPGDKIEVRITFIPELEKSMQAEIISVLESNNPSENGGKVKP